jgi:uncharacterized protein
MVVKKTCLSPVFIIYMLFLLLFLSFNAEAATENKFPRPVGAVNDYASVLSPKVKAAMEGLSREILQKTGASVVVATVKNLEGSNIDMYANELFTYWGIGKKGQDKGVLILLALEERKVRIETGYGVEGILPDGKVGRILDQYVVPLFKKGSYDRGLLNGMIAVGQVIAKDAGVTIGEGYTPKAPAGSRRMQRRPFGVFPIIVFIFLILSLFTRTGREMLPFVLLMMLSGRGGGGFGGGFGGGGFSGGFGGGMGGGGGAGRSF